MSSKSLYMKFVSLLFIIIGFGYCLTSFYNLISYLTSGVVIASNSIYLMAIGLFVPIMIFAFGLYFYFYNDEDREKINKFLIIVSVFMLLVGIFLAVISIGFNISNVSLQVMEFLHKSIGYALVSLSIILIYGIIKYKF